MSKTKVVAVGDPLVVTQAAANTLLSGVDLLGCLCNTSSGGTLTVTDTLPSGARTLVNAMPLISGQWYSIPFRTNGQVTITVGGTATITVCYDKD